ncbi:histidine kinase [Clostridium boliviensis]|uniref:Histidine kinase n=1 Tax=Clostridium boliviensis TaxID=318465 RepID=A0ABU4GFA3_9CLOT|nr:histidine kinase [Clostridium boliviensis]MDW2796292.1 histidine kinase [Clostridium boliviensis]
MESAEKRIHFRKTLYFKMIAVTALLGLTFLAALICIYHVTCKWFKTELTYQSDTLTEQICKNVDISLTELMEGTIPLTATNQRLTPLLRTVSGPGQEPDPFLKPRVRKQLEEILSTNYDINWVSVVDMADTVYLACRDSRPKEGRPNEESVRKLFHKNQSYVSHRPGNTIWTGSTSDDGIIVMRYLFDENTMKFSGCVIAELKNTVLKDIFSEIDSSKVGNFALYDMNGNLLFTTSKRNRFSARTVRAEEKDSYLYAEYQINRGRLKIAHEVDLKAKNRRFSDLLYFVSFIGLFLFLLIIIFLWLMFGNMASNLRILLSNIARVSRGNFKLEPTSFAKGDQMDLLSDHISQMAGHIQTLMDEIRNAKEIQQQNEYKLLEFQYYELQAQINPHFLFNILQSIHGIAQINGDHQVSRLIGLLARFFRRNIERSRSTCSLNAEIEYIKNYTELYKNIYPDRLEVEWAVDESLLDMMVPSCILQPIVENSLVHGMEPKIGLCTIRISVYSEDEKFVIKVWDDGLGIPPEKLGTLFETNEANKRIGIKNVKDRIQLMYGTDYGVWIESVYHHFTEVRLEFPLY